MRVYNLKTGEVKKVVDHFHGQRLIYSDGTRSSPKEHSDLYFLNEHQQYQSVFSSDSDHEECHDDDEQPISSEYAKEA